MMKRTKIILCLGLLAFSSMLMAGGIDNGSKLSIKVDALEGSQNLDQKTMSGKVNVVNFWATWCEACKVELVEMEQEFSKLMENKDFKFSFVSLDKDPSKAEAWVRANLKNPEKFIKHLYKDPSFETAEDLEIDSFPMTVVTGKDLKVSMIQRGFTENSGSTKKIAEQAEKLLQ
jgi:thiol-disulfide isomerase/thioredoxin